jgi:predicted ester cyclase
MSISESPVTSSAMAFFDACESGKGWDVCKEWCQDGASFSCQADTLAEITTLESYSEWMKGLLVPIPDLSYEIKAFAVDHERNSVSIYGVVHGTQTGEGGPVPPTGNRVTADYVYVMEFNGEKIRHLTKVWNDGHTLRQLGWA